MLCLVLPPDKEQCQKMDIIFVLDRSSSIKPSDYNKMRMFLTLVAERLKIGERDENGEVIGQGAIVTFSERGERRITLTESRDTGKFKNIVNTMPGPLPGGRTKTHLGLDVADKDVATAEAGLRVNDPEVKKIFMVITDGEQTKGGRGYKYVGEAIKPFFARDMDVFAVGIGLKKQTAIDEVRDMVEIEANAILPENYKELSEAVEKFVKKFCPGKLV